MPVREILLLGNELLWQPSKPIADATAATTRETIRDLADTLGDFRLRKGFGRAIAAPQIGVHQRVLFVKMDEPLPLVNPVITEASVEMMELWDDCFSFPDLMVRVRRHEQITVSYQNELGDAKSLVARGDLSELLQHEIDHLDGILAVDRALDLHSFALRCEIEKLRTQANI